MTAGASIAGVNLWIEGERKKGGEKHRYQRRSHVVSPFMGFSEPLPSHHFDSRSHRLYWPAQDIGKALVLVLGAHKRSLLPFFV